PAEIDEVGVAAIEEASGAGDPLDTPEAVPSAPSGLLVEGGMLTDLAAQTVLAPDLPAGPIEDADGAGPASSPSQAEPIPEPAAVVLFGVLAVLLVARR